MYNKTTWATGDVVTSTKLNNLEDGIGKAEPLCVTFTMSETAITCDTTAVELINAHLDGKYIYGKFIQFDNNWTDVDYLILSGLSFNNYTNDDFSVEFMNYTQGLKFTINGDSSPALDEVQVYQLINGEEIQIYPVPEAQPDDPR